MEPLGNKQATHDCKTWHITREHAHELRRWELRWLRKILRLKPAISLHEQYDRSAYNQRTATRIYEQFKQAGCRMMCHKVITAIHREAYREMNMTIGDGANPLLNNRNEHSALADIVEKATPAKKRRMEDRVRVRKGPPASKWKLPLTVVYGDNWRETRDTTSSNEWKEMEERFVKTLSEVWDLKGYWTKQ